MAAHHPHKKPKVTFFDGYRDHFGAKHKIIKSYVGGWSAISSKTSSLMYIDGFAGPGMYGNEEAGSPLVFLNAIAEHVLVDRFKTIYVLCNELDKDRAKMLKTTLDKALKVDGPLAKLKQKVQVVVRSSTFADFVDELSKLGENLRKTAIFGFVDPFGYKTASIAAVVKLYNLSDKCDLLINLMSRDLNRARGIVKPEGKSKLATKTKFQAHILAAVGDVELPQGQGAIAAQYEKMLQERGVKFTARFGVCSSPNGSGGVTYHLIFAARHRKALKTMKDCMWSATVAQPAKKGSGPFEELFYCQSKALIDDTNAQKKLDVAYPVARRLLLAEFGGKFNVHIKTVKDFLLTKTSLPVKVSWLKTMLKGAGIKWVLESDLSVIKAKEIAFGDTCDLCITFTSADALPVKQSVSNFVDVAVEYFRHRGVHEPADRDIKAFKKCTRVGTTLSKESMTTIQNELKKLKSDEDMDMDGGSGGMAGAAAADEDERSAVAMAE